MTRDRLHASAFRASQTKLIIATNGGTKNTKREQNNDIQRAMRLKEQYFTARQSEATTLHYIRIDHEDPEHPSKA